jgi:diacylglycerol kinase (ATP)
MEAERDPMSPAPLVEAESPSSPPAPSLARTLRSFGFAGAGLRYLIATQPNFRVHVAAAVTVVALALAVGATALELAVLALAISLVMVGESFNTALEAVVDLASPAVHPLARIAKDVAAAGVLIAALLAVVVGLLILGPRLLALLWP